MGEATAVAEQEGPGTLSWKWLAGIALAVVGFLVATWMKAVADDLDTLAKTVTQSLSSHGERLASLEARDRSTTDHLDRIEEKLDRVLERK